MMEYVEASRMRHIHKNDRRAVNKAPSRNRPRKCVLHRGVRSARAHAALLAPDGLFLHRIFLGQSRAQKQRHTNGLYCGCAEKTPRLPGLPERHSAPNGSYDPNGIFAQSPRAGLIHAEKDCELFFGSPKLFKLVRVDCPPENGTRLWECPPPI
jgi:hypothetical protein